MKKDFIVRRSITIVEGKPHVETYSESELVRCKDCRFDSKCKDRPLKALNDPDWYCAGGVRKEGDGDG